MKAQDVVLVFYEYDGGPVCARMKLSHEAFRWLRGQARRARLSFKEYLMARIRRDLEGDGQQSVEGGER